MMRFIHSFFCHDSTNHRTDGVSQLSSDTLQKRHHAAVRKLCLNFTSIGITLAFLAATLGSSLLSAIISIIFSAHQIRVSTSQMQDIEEVLRDRGVAAPRWRKRDIFTGFMLAIGQAVLDVFLPGLFAVILDAFISALDVDIPAPFDNWIDNTLAEYIQEIYDALGSHDRENRSTYKRRTPVLTALRRRIRPFADLAHFNVNLGLANYTTFE